MYRLYDKCLLSDGRTGWVIEIFGGGEAYMIELDKAGIEDRIVTVKSSEVKSKIAG
ncbi:MAG: hypothetical protein LUD83_03395 [Clostridiales bacterium]|nr:hypothetical protein [Clostridiales bacterium]